ncbi:MAG TPA: tyrosine--tRNA ligase [Acidimicrobiales bacterium]
MTLDVYTDLEWRGLVHQKTHDDLAAGLTAAPITLYHGIDATAGSLHVGNLLGVLTLQRFQRAGHRPLPLLGGATTLIGDPSGKADERPMLPAEAVRANVDAIREQLERFLEFGTAANDAVLVNNLDWLGPFNLLDFLRDVGKHFPVNVMIAKESVRARLAGGISFTEFSYMLLQAYDFLHLHETMQCRLQVGGSDQWGNITAGVELVRRIHSTDAWGLTWPLITKPDGTKFGKSEAGNVWLDPAKTSPYQFFQFWYRTEDSDVGRYLRMYTLLDAGTIEDLESHAATQPAARRAQQVLAVEVTTAVHGAEAAEAAVRASQALFGGKLEAVDEETLAELFAEAPSSTLARSALEGAGAPLLDLLVRTGLTDSRSAARSALEQGGVYVNNERAVDAERRLTPADLIAGGSIILRRGKRSYHVVRFR